MKDTRSRIAIYSRKSKFTGKGESIENQIELCRNYIHSIHDPNNVEILIFEDEGFSGGTLERPKFKEMMKIAREKNLSAIVCYRLDRISRNIGDFANLIQELDKLSISFISIREQFDTTSPMGRAMMYIASVFSQLERETIAERIRDNMHELSKTGRWLGGMTPTGYESTREENITIDGKVKKSCNLKLLPHEAEIIKTIYNKFLETNSLTQTEMFLLQNGIKTKNGREYKRFAIRGILTNPVYMISDEDAYNYLVKNNVEMFSGKEKFNGKNGILAYNRTDQKPGQAAKIKEMNEWIVTVGKHEGIIDGATWIKVQGMIDQNKSKSYRKPKSNVALLSGLIYCGNCHDYMRPKLSKLVNEYGEQKFDYLCKLKERSRQYLCSMKNPNGNMLDRAVINEIKKISEDSSEFIKELEKGKNNFERNKSDICNNIDKLKQELNENERKINDLVSSLTNAAGSNAQNYIIKQIDELHDAGEILKQRISNLNDLTKDQLLSNIEFDVIRDILSSFKDTIDDMTIEQKRAAIRTFVKKIVWDGKNVHIYMFGSDDDKILDENIAAGLKNSPQSNITK